MEKNRLEAFSDAIIAIIMTIMVLDLRAPAKPSLTALIPLIPIFLCYFLSFIYLAIYWNNHHHLFYSVKQINGKILWANIHLLFWLSLIPFVTSWAGELEFATFPTFLYGFVLFMAGMAYHLLTNILITHENKNSFLRNAIGNDVKGKLSVVSYGVAMFLAFWLPIGAFLIYLAVAIMWIIPDQRIENKIK